MNLVRFPHEPSAISTANLFHEYRMDIEIPTWAISFLCACLAILGAFSLQRFIGFRNASTKFRSAVLTSTSRIPGVNEHWGSEVVDQLPKICSDVKLAVFEFEPHLQGLTNHKAQRFISDRESLERHCSEHVPKSLSAAEVMFGGGPSGALKAKEQFFGLVKQLLRQARET